MFPKRFALSFISACVLVALSSTAVVALGGDDSTQWTLLGESLSVDDLNAQWGSSVALNDEGTIVATGAPKASIGSATDQGRVGVYQFVNETWIPRGATLSGANTGSFFGQSVSLSSSGGVLAVGAPGAGAPSASQGSVRIFDDTPGGWILRGEPILPAATGELFGRAVALSADGSTVVIGAPLDSLGGLRSGAVSVWTWSGTAWALVGDPIPGAIGDQLGVSVAVSADGTIIAAGGPNHLSGRGIVWLYTFDGATWKPHGGEPILGNATGDNAGTSVSLDATGRTVAVGSPFSKIPGEVSRGSVEVFDVFDGSWLKRGDTLYAAATGDRFGASVSLDNAGIRLGIGAPRNADAGLRAGHARVFHFDSGGWQPLGVALPGRSAGDEAGTATAISGAGSRVALGSPLRAMPSLGSGEVRVFEFPVSGLDEELERERESAHKSSGGLPGIHLHVLGLPGRLVTQTTVHFGAYRVAPNSRYVLRVESVGMGTHTSAILAQGVVNGGGHLGSSLTLDALVPGDYTVTLRGIHAGGTGLRLSAPFTVGYSADIVRLSPNIPGIW